MTTLGPCSLDIVSDENLERMWIGAAWETVFGNFEEGRLKNRFIAICAEIEARKSASAIEMTK